MLATATARRVPFLLRSVLFACFSFLIAGSLFAQSATLGPDLESELDATLPGETLVVIVTFDGEELTDAQAGLVQNLGVAEAIAMPEFSMMGVVATPAQVESLMAEDAVRSIWSNREIAFHNDESTQITGVDALQADGEFTDLNGDRRVDGAGITVLVNDTGIDGLHPDLAFPEHVVGNVQASMNPRGVNGILPPVFVEDVPNTDVLGGHGTHVAGTVGGTGAQSGGTEAGVAPGADLVGYGSGAGILLLDTVGGLYYALVNQFAFDHPIRVTNNSWGPLGGGTFDEDNPVNVATKRLHDRGIISVFAGGNDGAAANTLTPYAAPWVLTVAAGNKDGQTLADFSSRGAANDCRAFTTPDGQNWTYCNEPTLTAPGVGVTSPRNSVEVPPGTDLFYTDKSGTSMAAPHVAGIVALLLDADPQMTFEEVRDALTGTATPMDGYEPFEVGAGFANAYAATAVALGLDPAPYLGLPGEDENLPDNVVLTDAEGDASMAGTDLTQAAIVNETSDAFEVTLSVNDLDQATPSTLVAAGLQFGAIQEYTTEFDLQKEGAATARYILDAKRTLVEAAADGAALSAPSYGFGVRAADGSGRSMGTVEGIWDDAAGTITWIVLKDELNVAAPPADLTGDIDRSGRAAEGGDDLRAFSAATATSIWGGAVGLTPGQTTYDEATSGRSYTLADGEGGGGEGEGEGGGDNPPATREEIRNVRPVLECVAANGDGTHTAVLGYLNENDRAVTLPVGRDNRFHPRPFGRGQLTTFEPGRHRAALEVTFDRPILVWKLGRRVSVATRRSPTCPEPNAPQVVTSVIDSGINPYHAFFNAGSAIYPDGAPSAVTPEVRAAFGIDAAHTIDLTRTGDFAADFAADQDIWDAIEPGEVYWFKGTNVLAVTFDEDGTRPILPDDEGDTHGVGTAAAALRANPQGVMLFIEGVNASSETFAFTHPAVDIVSTSYGIPGSVPLPGHITDSYTGVVENGKLHFGAADNSPSTAIQDGTAGPWWSIGVAGFEEEDSEGKQVLSGSLPDFVGDFTQTLPYCAECEDGQQSVGGTSFATPRSAGTMSKILLETRRALGHTGGIADADGTPVMAAGDGRTVSNWQLRRALEQGAYYPTISDYSAVDGVFDQIAVPVPEQAPYALTGWGAITPEAEHDVIPQTLAHLDVGDGEATRTKSADACTFNTAVIEARRVYWNTANVESQSFGTTDDPYVYCGGEGENSLLAAGSEDVAGTPAAFELTGNYPNPLRSRTTVGFTLPARSAVTLTVYDVLGREVMRPVDQTMTAGRHDVPVDADQLASGTYFYRLETDHGTETKQMVVVK